MAEGRDWQLWVVCGAERLLFALLFSASSGLQEVTKSRRSTDKRGRQRAHTLINVISTEDPAADFIAV